MGKNDSATRGLTQNQSEDNQVTVLLMTLNEFEGLKHLEPDLRDIPFNIVVVDGGSTDGTIEFAKGLGLKVFVQERRGIRSAYNEVWPELPEGIVVTFSCDGSSLVEGIGPLVDQIRQGADLAIASRYLGGLKSDDDTMITAFGNRIFRILINRLHRGNYSDPMVMFRAFHTSLPRMLQLDQEAPYRLPERFFATKLSWEPLMSVRAARSGLVVHEIAVREPKRVGGEAKLQIVRWGLGYLWQVFADYFRPFNPDQTALQDRRS